ncbi:MAG: NTP transferase domain-containing protein [Actinomycetota bacterium]
MSTVAIVLAADSGPGFPGPKYLTPIHNVPLLQHVVNDAVTWPVDDVFVVLGADAEQVIDAVDFKNLTIVIDPEWSEGAASPLRAGLDLASRNRSTRRCVIARGDQPGIDADSIGALVDAVVDAEADAAVPKYRYSVGWPVVLEFSIWEHLLGSEGSVDILDFVTSHASSVEEVWFDHLAPATYTTAEDLP